MRISLAVDVYHSYVSGVTRHISLLKACLEQRGHEVFVITFDRPGTPNYDPSIVSSPAIFSTQNYSWGIGYAQKARRLVNQVDLVHVHHPFVSGPLVRRYTRGRIPVVFTNHTRYDLYLKAYLPWMPSSLGNYLLFQNLRRYTRTVDCLIAPSPGMQAVMRSWGLPEPIVVIPNGIYLQPFFDPPNTLRRKDLGLAEDDFVWVFVGRVSPEKNLLFLLDAFHQALSDNPHMSLLIVGDGPLIPALTQIVADLHLEQKIVFAGLVEYEQLPAYLRLANAFATASQTEVHPLTLIEAIASGLPVVGIRSPGVADIVVHGVNGYLCEPDLEEFADKMVALSTQTDQYHSRSQAARQSAQQYSIEHTTDSLVTLYEQTIQARKRDRSRI